MRLTPDKQTTHMILRQYTKPVCNSYELSLLLIFEKNELTNQVLREKDELCPDRRNPVQKYNTRLVMETETSKQFIQLSLSKYMSTYKSR